MNIEISVKKILMIIGVLVVCSIAGSLKDSRDGKTYKTVKMPDGKTWMAENLNYKVPGSNGCFDEKPNKCKTYGRLYSWESAMKACPAGWHLPSNKEWSALFRSVGGWTSAEKNLKSDHGWYDDKCVDEICRCAWGNERPKPSGLFLECDSRCQWKCRKWKREITGNGSDSYGFSVLPAGMKTLLGGFNYEGGQAHFWSSSANASESESWNFGNVVNGHSLSDKRLWLSVRCVEGEDNPEEEMETFVDNRDGQKYKMVKMPDSNIWMAENLNFKKAGSLCSDKNSTSCEKYGRLYTWDAAAEACPNGWHLPSSDEFIKLLASVGNDENTRARALKSVEIGGDDLYGFSVLSKNSSFWSSSYEDNKDAAYQLLNVSYSNADISSENPDLYTYYYSVRCIKNPNEDSVGFSQQKSLGAKENSLSTMTDDRDGKVYKTIEMSDGKVWMAENLNYETSGSSCYGENSKNCEKYGRLYTRDAAIQACPAGWYLPFQKDFVELLGGKAKSRPWRVKEWNDGSDDIGFSALPAGYYKGGEFINLGDNAIFWSATTDKQSYGRILDIGNYHASVIQNDDREGKFSVRCIKKPVKKNELMTDVRDGKTYKTVQMPDGKVWMAENLNYQMGESKCYDDKPENCEKYGRLYTWDDAKKACPAGWRLPSKAEFERFLATVGSSNDEISLNLRAGIWEKGLDMFGFSALPAGDYNRYYKEFDSLGNNTSFWSSTELNSGNAYYLRIRDNYADVYYYVKIYGYSVRCLQDSNEGGEVSSQRSEAQPPSGTLKDSRDGKTYRTVKMPDGKVWMAENLNYPIGNSKCYDNKEGNCKKYGRLYTWDDAKKACPAGWHLPSKAEFESLRATVGSSNDEISLNLRAGIWEKGSDMFGFSALPAGHSYSKEFGALGYFTHLWTSTEHNSNKAYYLGIYGRYAGVNDYSKHYGYSVRCLQDSNEGSEVTSQRSEAQPSSGTLKDFRDGKTYKTMKMPDGKVWMAENLNYKTSESKCYDYKEGNCKKYGRLYTWNDAKKACPNGWHLPSKEELESLLSTVGTSEAERSRNLRAGSWENGADEFGFSALPAGFYSSSRKKFYFLGNDTDFWYSTEFNSDDAYRLGIDDNRAYVYYDYKINGHSVRCLQD
ncbi:MAG: hypothetical protein MJY93_09200 [Fibrobacter sp.]|nr:hypothetical protein [Fibrobacter sp.]